MCSEKNKLNPLCSDVISFMQFPWYSPSSKLGVSLIAEVKRPIWHRKTVTNKAVLEEHFVRIQSMINLYDPEILYKAFQKIPCRIRCWGNKIWNPWGKGKHWGWKKVNEYELFPSAFQKNL